MVGLHPQFHKYIQIGCCSFDSRGNFLLCAVKGIICSSFHHQLPKYIINPQWFCFKDCVWDVLNCRRLTFENCNGEKQLCCKYYEQDFPTDPFGGIKHWSAIFANQKYTVEEFCWTMAKIGRLFVPLQVFVIHLHLHSPLQAQQLAGNSLLHGKSQQW